jgi:peptide/nickel transport system permease protein
MLQYVVNRVLLFIPSLAVISLVCFMVIELPPGDFLTSYVGQLRTSGETVDQDLLAALEKRYGLDQPIYVRYLKWVRGILQGDFGVSFEWNKPVSEILWSRLLLTVVVSFSTLMFTWVVAFPIGLYSATHQYSVPDYLFTFVGFIGLAIPNFMIALVFLWLAFSAFGINLGGLFSEQFVDQPWSLAKVLDMLKHLWLPLIVLGTSGTAGLIRTFRANLLDELHKPYVTTARAKGLAERKVLYKYPVRVALSPFVSTVGWSLPFLISGSTIVSVVLGLPTSGPVLFKALLSQDMYLASSFVLMLSFLTLVGTFISDILLLWLDPRIRYSR